MNQADIEALAKGMAPVVRDTIAKSLAPVVNRLVALEAREPLQGEKGEDGKDGRDGFRLEDFGARVLEDDRTIELTFNSGEHQHIATLKWPTVIDRGVFKEGQAYDAGDAVSWGGSLWIAQRDTSSKPDTADSGWRLAVKRGRDGKDAK